jgi:sugar lactone lactonase YvrE
MVRRGWLCALALALAAGCAAPKQQARVTLFYPPPPEPPRLQWLTSLTTARDVEPEQTAFNRFVVGEEKVVRRLDKPYGVAAHDGRVYVCDTNRTVMVFDLKAHRFEPLPGAQGAGRLVQPVNISIEADGTKYVADPVRGQVVVFGPDDQFVRAFGSPGAWKPVDAVASGDLLFVADVKGAAVVVLDKKTGRLVRRIGRDGGPAETLYIPTNLAFDPAGTLYVSDTGKFGVFKYRPDGQFAGSVGRLGTSPGSFARPKGIAVDRDGRLFVVDSAFSNVQVFRPDGLLLMWFGHFGKTGRDPGELFLPAKVAVDYGNIPWFQQFAAPGFQIEALVFVTSQFGDRMVNVYGFGRQQGREYPSDAELKDRLDEMLRTLQPQPPATPAAGEPGAPDAPGAPTEPRER